MEQERQSHFGGRGPRIAGRIVRGIVIGIGFALLFGIFVRLLWNWLMPAVFNLPMITFGQAVGLVILAHILFGAKGMHHGMRPRFGHGPWAWGGPCSHEGLANGRIRDWRRYDEWWETEGREAFRKYVDNHTKEKEA